MSDEEEDRLLDEAEAALEDDLEDDEGEDLDDEDAGGKKVLDSSEEEEEEDGQNEYEDDGFVVNEDAEEEDDDEEDVEESRKKRKKKRKSLKLDEDDYDLLEENDVKVKRPKEGVRKRLKRAGDVGATDAEQMRADLFGDEDLEDELEEDIGRRRGGDGGGGRDEYEEDGGGRGRQEEEDLFVDDDEMGDFIVEEGADVGRARRRRRAALAMPGVNSRALEEAADIFGNVDDLLEVYQTTRAMRPGEDLQEDPVDYENQDEYADEDEDEDAFEARRAAKEETRRNKMLQRAMKVLDPETIAAQHLLPQDQTAADWIYDRLFSENAPKSPAGVIVEEGVIEVDGSTQGVLLADGLRMYGYSRHNDPARAIVEEGVIEVDGSTQSVLLADGSRMYGCNHHSDVADLGGLRMIRERRHPAQRKQWQRNTEAQEALKEAIKQVLALMYEKLEEVPLIGMYRKELAGELLAMFRAETESNEEDDPDAPRKDPMDDVPSHTHRNSMHQDGPAYRREIYKPGSVQARHRKIRRYHVLWQVMEYSIRFRKLVKRKAALTKRVEAAIDVLKEPADEVVTLETLHSFLVNDAESWVDESLNDVDARLKLMSEAHPELGLLSLSLGSAGGATVKKASGRGMYKQLVEAGLQDIVRKLRSEAHLELGLLSLSLGEGAVVKKASGRGMYKQLVEAGLQDKVLMTPAQFAENLAESDTQPNDVEEPAVIPNDWFEAQLYERTLGVHGITSGEELRKRIKLMAVQELIAEPGVRQQLRKAFTEHATITTAPTPAGESHPSMDPWAKYGIVKRIQNKSLTDMGFGDLFLKMVGAARENLITIKLGIDKSKLEGPYDVLQEVCKLYCSVNVSTWAKAWNEFRVEVVREAVLKHLFPAFENEHKQRLLSEAKDAALAEIEYAFWRLAARPPLRIRIDNADNDGGMDDEYVETPRIMSVCWGPGQETPTMVVALDERGNLVDLLPCGQLSGNVPKSGKSTRDIFLDERKTKDVERIRDFLFEENARIFQQLETNHIEVLYADERLAALWENCRAAKDEFPEQPPHVRRAIALGRLHLDPLSILAQLCGAGREVLSIKLSELQHLLQPEERLKCIEQTRAKY
eukprot:gene17810-24188_t